MRDKHVNWALGICSALLILVISGCWKKTAAGAAAGENDQTEEKMIEAYKTGINIKNSTKLFDVINEQNSEANTIFSPLSLNFALGMLAEGCSGNTRAQINDYLETENYSEVAASYMERAESLNQDTSDLCYEGYKSVLNIANSFWVNGDYYHLNPAYSKKVSSVYQAEIEEMSFADRDSVCGKINRWCDQKTEAMIPEILTQDMLSEKTAVILANALYFESPWEESWQLNETPQKFIRADGTREQTQYMEHTVAEYYENENAIAFGAGYADGMRFIGILPKAKGDFSMEGLDIAGLLQNNRSEECEEIYARMPKLNFETTVDLKQCLAGAGVSDIFIGTGEINGIVDSSEGCPVFLQVSVAVQKAKIELNENGTRAAAATMITLDKCADVATKVKNITLDRPFAFLIYDEEAEEILFMGKVTSSQMEN